MKLLVLGATGNLGSEVVRQASAAGDDVLAYVRRPDAVTAHERVTVVAGELDDVNSLADAASGADAAVVSITGSMTQGDFMQGALPPILQGLTRAGVSRLVLVSVFGAGETSDKASGPMRLVYKTVLRRFLRDKAESEKSLQNSELNYTIVYPVNLKDGPALGEKAVERLEDVRKVPGMPTLTFADVASALLSVTSRTDLSGARLLVTTSKGWRPVGSSRK